MLHFERWKIWAIIGVCLLGLLFALPNLFDRETTKSWPTFLQTRVNLGLDLRGGVYLMMEADVGGLQTDMVRSAREQVRSEMRKANIPLQPIEMSPDGVRFRPAKPEDAEKAMATLRAVITTIGGSAFSPGVPSAELRREADGRIYFGPTEAAIRARISEGMESAQEVIRRRIDPAGVTEPSISKQGLDRVVIQVPGLDDPAQLIKLVGSPAKLTFHEVDRTKSVQEAEKTGVPPGSQLFNYAEGGGKILLKSVPVVTGEELESASGGFEQQTNRPAVFFRFRPSGAFKFGKFTSENLQQPFAIVLDDTVISVPTIQSAITTGSGQITGNFTIQSANELAIQLSSGALPFKLSVKEQRTVGASLGADSIRAGIIATVIGSIAVAVFMMLAYGLFGFFSVLAMITNMVLLIGAMSLLHQTLTLPGIAGILLTAGMAVDSNVLIYERIREELRAGKSAIMAIDLGFQRAFVTILDSQLTTLVAGILMFALGTGPIRGFAVSLTIGLVLSIFTAFTITRLFIALWLRRQRQTTKQIVVPV